MDLIKDIKNALHLTPGRVIIEPPEKEQDLTQYVDGPADILPGTDESRDRDHFPDDMPEEEIDQILAAFDNPYTRKTGCFEPEPDGDPDNFSQSDDSDPDDD